MTAAQRVCIIVNPIAGRGRALKAWRRIEPLVADLAGFAGGPRRPSDPAPGPSPRSGGPGSDASYAVWFTESPGHGEKLARRAAAEGYDRVAVVGGDGTLNEVANGLIGLGPSATGAGAPGHTGVAPALAIIPAGTANDLARTFPIPQDPKAAARLAFEGRVVRIDAGLAETTQVRRYFINMFGAGFDAEVAGLVNDIGPFVKRLGGAVAIPVCLIMTLVRYRFPRLTLTIDAETIEVPRLIFSAVAVCRYIGNGMKLLPDADPSDGLLDVVWAQEMSRPEILRTVQKTYTGRHIGHPKVHFTRGRRFRLEASSPLHCHVDGESGGFLPATIEVVPEALGLVVGGEGDSSQQWGGGGEQDVS